MLRPNFPSIAFPRRPSNAHFFLFLFLFLTALSSVFLFPSQASARWDHRQAEGLNRFDKQGPEYFNDLLSYRAPWSWQNASDDSLVKVKTGAGSLNQKDFAFEQSADISTSREEEWQLAFESVRFDDRRYELEQNQITLGYTPKTSGLNFRVLADGFGAKAYNDLGLGLGLFGTDWNISLNAWAVDPFYESKKEEAEDKREGDIYSYTLALQKKVGNSSIALSLLHDTPVHWHQSSLGKVYTYEKKAAEVDLSFKDGSTLYYTDLSLEWIEESLGDLTYQETPAYEHADTTLELGVKGEHGRAKSQIAFWTSQAFTKYRGLTSDLRFESPAEDTELHDLTRREYAVFTTWHEPWSPSSPHAQQWGLFVNRLNKEEGKDRVYSEIKAQWALDWAIGKQGRFLLGTTWDLDEVSLFAKGDRPFRPWGGGYTQILIHF